MNRTVDRQLLGEILFVVLNDTNIPLFSIQRKTSNLLILNGALGLTRTGTP
jgi:hypothetical protein